MKLVTFEKDGRSAVGLLNAAGTAVHPVPGCADMQTLIGIWPALDTAAVRDVLAQFTDYVTTPEWAREGLAFCYQEGILDDSAMEIQGKTEILRCEIAQMLYNLLSSAKLL